MIKTKLRRLVKKIKKYIKNKKDRWTLYLYYDGMLVKTLKIDKDEAPADQTYCITIRNRNLYKGKVSVIVRPIRLLKNDEKHHRTYWGVSHELGVEIGE